MASVPTSMDSMSSRAALLQATKDLLAAQGYVRTSPRHILERSGTGQGSLYHHFRGKGDLASAALQEVSAEMQASADALLDPAQDPVQAVHNWLLAERDALAGCRLGRLAAEPIIDHPELTAPIDAYFRHVLDRLGALLARAGADGRLPPGVQPAELATALVATVQGGYVLARASGDPGAMERAQAGASRLLQAVCAPVASPQDEGEQP
jgi:TetR/AcrR family transcriptional repressor of nem operon